MDEAEELAWKITDPQVEVPTQEMMACRCPSCGDAHEKQAEASFGSCPTGLGECLSSQCGPGNCLRDDRPTVREEYP